MHWWQTAVFYQIYPRSFADGNGDGIGDFQGMIERLDYLASLGVTALWLSPHYPSPQFDCGYDIADYQGVNPEYGTLEEFKQFLDGAHQRGMRVILDLVLNHTSDQHPWFIESRSSRDNPRRDWYIWRDGKNGGPPNNWYSTFDGLAWTLDESTGQYYYHYFFKEQPDLNWRNPQVKQAMWQAVRFWLDLGVDGFRLDAIGTIYEDPNLTNHPVNSSLVEIYREFASTGIESPEFMEKFKSVFQYQTDLPEAHDLMRELRSLVNTYPERVLVGETEEIAYYGNGDDELHLVFNFPLMQSQRLTPPVIRANQAKRLAALPPGAWPCNTLGNHDSPRVKSRFGDGDHTHAQARLWLALMLTLKGTPFLYNGEEIGMTDYYLSDASLVRDNVAHSYYQSAMRELSMPPEAAFQLIIGITRDKCRTPMQWDNLPNAGFSPEGIAPWLPVNPNYAEGINVVEQEQDPHSLLNFYRKLIRLRQKTPALIEGDYQPVHEMAEDYLAFLRTTPAGDQACLVVLNLSERELQLNFELSQPFAYTLFSTPNEQSWFVEISWLTIGPFGVYIGLLTSEDRRWQPVTIKLQERPIERLHNTSRADELKLVRIIDDMD